VFKHKRTFKRSESCDLIVVTWFYVTGGSCLKTFTHHPHSLTAVVQVEKSPIFNPSLWRTPTESLKLSSLRRCPPNVLNGASMHQSSSFSQNWLSINSRPSIRKTVDGLPPCKPPFIMIFTHRLTLDNSCQGILTPWVRRAKIGALLPYKTGLLIMQSSTPHMMILELLLETIVHWQTYTY
jgi:hypothetical protein